MWHREHAAAETPGAIPLTMATCTPISASVATDAAQPAWSREGFMIAPSDTAVPSITSTRVNEPARPKCADRGESMPPGPTVG